MSSCTIPSASCFAKNVRTGLFESSALYHLLTCISDYISFDTSAMRSRAFSNPWLLAIYWHGPLDSAVHYCHDPWNTKFETAHAPGSVDASAGSDMISGCLDSFSMSPCDCVRRLESRQHAKPLDGRLLSHGRKEYFEVQKVVTFSADPVRRPPKAPFSIIIHPTGRLKASIETKSSANLRCSNSQPGIRRTASRT